MKKTILLVLSCFMIAAINAQNIVKEHYTVSGGLLGAANFSTFRLSSDDNSHGDIDYDWKGGWSAGAWVNFPVGTTFSIEPQVMYSSYRFTSNSTVPLLIKEGNLKFFTVPVLLKFHLGDKFAITAGPQFDFLSSVDDDPSTTAIEEDFNQTSFSAFGGLELFPRGRVTVFGRYIHGISNMDERSGSNTEYRISTIQAGLKLRLFGSKVEADSDGDGVIDKDDKCPNQFGYARYNGCPIPDTDADGINDEQDKCPNEAGTAKYNGCPIPDTDKDGINDEMDKCPTEAGTAKYNGCPVPDTDGDGLNDEVDKCPTQAGPADRDGCPVTDKDNDGVNDDVDKCPDVPGVASNNGCPDVPASVVKTISASAQNISFGSGTAKLTTSSHASLNRIVTIMNENPTLKLRIEGHTDNAGDDDANMTLSKNRAEAVEAYLVSKGISEDRIETEGFGETMPIADNKTAAGRTKNRRVEIKIDY